MRSDVLKQLLKAHAASDPAAFRKAALQLAASESKAGHIRVAEELRAIIAELPIAQPQQSRRVLEFGQARGELQDLLEGGYRDERLRDIVLPDDDRLLLTRVLQENRERAELESWGVPPRRRLLFWGPPGCGKTLTAKVIAGELGLPLMTVRFDGLFSRFLGATAGHLKVIFDEMPRRPAVYLFDEFDAIGKHRGDNQDIGEVRRVVTSFLQLMDADRSSSVIIAATNFDEVLDRAVFRRFDVAMGFELPSASKLRALLGLRLQSFKVPSETISKVAKQLEGLSFADATRVCDDAIRTMALDRRRQLEPDDLFNALKDAKRRRPALRPMVDSL